MALLKSFFLAVGTLVGITLTLLGLAGKTIATGLLWTGGRLR